MLHKEKDLNIWVNVLTLSKENITRKCLVKSNNIVCTVLGILDTIDILRGNFEYNSTYTLYASNNLTEFPNLGSKNFESLTILFKSSFIFDLCNLRGCKNVIGISKIKSITWVPESTKTTKIEANERAVQVKEGVKRYFTLTDFSTNHTTNYETFSKFLDIKNPCNTYEYCMVTEWKYCMGNISKQYVVKDCMNLTKSSELSTNNMICDFQSDFPSLVLSSQYLEDEKIYFNKNGHVSGNYPSMLLQNLSTSTSASSLDENQIKLNGCIDCVCFNERITCNKPNTVIISNDQSLLITIISIALISIVLFITVAIIILVRRYINQGKVYDNNENIEIHDGEINEEDLVHPAPYYAEIVDNVPTNSDPIEISTSNPVTDNSGYTEILPRNDDCNDAEDDRLVDNYINPTVNQNYEINLDNYISQINQDPYSDLNMQQETPFNHIHRNNSDGGETSEESNHVKNEIPSFDPTLNVLNNDFDFNKPYMDVSQFKQS